MSSRPINSVEYTLAAQKVTSTLIANILNKNGPMPIRAITKGVTEEIPIFEKFSPSKQRRIIMKTMAKGEPQNCILFKKVGWGQWTTEKVARDEFDTQRAIVNDRNANFIEATSDKKKLLGINYDSKYIEENVLISDDETSEDVKQTLMNQHRKRSRRSSFNLMRRNRLNSISNAADGSMMPKLVCHSGIRKNSIHSMDGFGGRRKSSVVLSNAASISPGHAFLKNKSGLISDDDILGQEIDNESISHNSESHHHYLPQLKPMQLRNDLLMGDSSSTRSSSNHNPMYDSLANSPIGSLTNKLVVPTNHYIINHHTAIQDEDLPRRKNSTVESSVRSTLLSSRTNNSVDSDSFSDTDDEDWESIGALSLRTLNKDAIKGENTLKSTASNTNNTSNPAGSKTHNETDVASLLLSLRS